MNINEQIRAEIERRHAYQKEMYNKTKPDGRPNDGWAESLAIMGELEELTNYLDTLQQPVLPGIDEEGIPGKDFIPVEWVDTCERYGKLKIVRVEQPASEGLEKEIARYLREECSADDEPSISEIARHFAEWGAEHAGK